MNPLVYRQKLINIAKNLKNSGNFFSNEVIQIIEDIINYCYNLQFKHSQHLKQKLDIIIVKYKLNIIDDENKKKIIFTKINRQFDLTVLYKQLADFLCKIQFFINLANNDIEQLSELFAMLDNQLLNDISTIPMQNQSNQKINNYNQVVNEFLKIEKIISKVVLEGRQSGQVNNISCSSENVDKMKAQTFLKDPLKQSDVKTLID